MEIFSVYIPADRRQALASGESLPDRAVGAALFADISGFTQLTEMLVRSLGAQRGAEELPRQLNEVYDALVAQVDTYGGSVISFAGDAITCWFDDERPARGDGRPAPGAWRASACALAMQEAMAPFAQIVVPGAGPVALAVKIAVATGPARRFVIGDPAIQLVDALAGATVARLAEGEHLAGRGDVLLDTATVAALGELAILGEWRTSLDDEPFALLSGLHRPVEAAPWPPLPPEALDEPQVRRWILPPVYERLRLGHGEFLTELRPTVAMFLRFTGIDYDEDDLAQLKLDSYILWVQRILKRYDSYMLQLTIGDKGSYLYAAFGAPVAHEDDGLRAVLAALELREPRLEYIGGVQIGLSHGRTRMGTYGGATRRTYGALGDDVNIAARLMQSAPPGQVYVSQGVRRSTGDDFAWESLAPMLLKGKSQPFAVHRLVGHAPRRSIRLHEPRYALPMIGRSGELAVITERMGEAARGHGRIVGIVAEAGLGKSRLIAEAIRLARGQEFTAHTGECQSYGSNTSYLAWQNIWRAIFAIDGAWPPAEQAAALRVELARLDPNLLPRMPLLGAVLGLSLPDSDLTRHFEPRLRKTSLESLLVSVLRLKAAEAPLVLVIEDCQWLDPLSHDLLEAVGRAVADMPVLILLTYRPFQIQRLQTPRVEQLAHFSELRLNTLPPAQVEALIQLKLTQLFDAGDDPPRALVERVSARAQGNPFYIEELLNYLRDRGIDPSQPGGLEKIELPPSLHRLILSRIDQLTENQKTLLKIASVVGRLFRAAVLWGIGAVSAEQARSDLDVLSSLELTPLDQPEPELVYLFKHVATQEVAYESLAFATRAALHEQIGRHLEQAAGATSDSIIDLLAFHFDRSLNQAKRRQYLLLAADGARASYANLVAIDYYRRALEVIPPPEQAQAQLHLGQVLELVGQWDEADACYRQALALSQHHADAGVIVESMVGVGDLLRRRGSYPEAAEWYRRARAEAEGVGNVPGVARVLNAEGTLAAQQGRRDEARTLYELSLAIRREVNDLAGAANCLNNLAIIARGQGDQAQARAFHEEALAIRRQIGNRSAIANSLNNLGNVDLDQGQFGDARRRLHEAVALQREVGDAWALGNALNNLGNAARALGDYDEAAHHYEESLLIYQRLGDRWALAYLLEDVGCLAALVGRHERALRLVGAAETLRESIGAPLSPREQATLTAAIAPARAALADPEAALATGRALDLPAAIAAALA